MQNTKFSGRLGLPLFAVLLAAGGGLSCATPAARDANSSHSLIGDPVTLLVFVRDNLETGAALIQVPFKRDIEGTVTFSVFFDFNGDGRYDEAECGVSGVPAPVERNLASGFPVLFGDPASIEKLLRMSRKAPVPVRILLEDVPGEGTVKRETSAVRQEWEAEH